MEIALTNERSGLTRKLQAPDYWTIQEIERWNDWSGHYFFTPDTKRFFRSRILDEVFQGPGGVYFVTSERFGPEAPRRYSVRQFHPSTGEVDTARDDQGEQLRGAFKTAAYAKRAARVFANGA